MLGWVCSLILNFPTNLVEQRRCFHFLQEETEAQGFKVTACLGHLASKWCSGLNPELTLFWGGLF